MIVIILKKKTWICCSVAICRYVLGYGLGRWPRTSSSRHDCEVDATQTCGLKTLGRLRHCKAVEYRRAFKLVSKTENLWPTKKPSQCIERGYYGFKGDSVDCLIAPLPWRIRFECALNNRVEVFQNLIPSKGRSLPWYTAAITMLLGNGVQENIYIF